MSFEEKLSDYTKYAEEVLLKYLPEEKGEQIELLKAMNYSLTAGGKRLRPIMMAEAYHAAGGLKKEIVEPFMAGIEMIHTHSLVHDDLPEMDNDMYRRGKLTTHAVYGQAMAVLAGDALLNYAYETIGRAFEMDADTGCLVKAMRIIMDKTGSCGMMGGQSVDVLMEGKSLTAEQLYFIYEKKTGALLEASLMAGAALAGTEDDELQKWEKIGSNVGRAFQIQDDILDEIGDEKLLGKPLHSDEKNHKVTYVSLYGMENARQRIRELTDEAVQLLDEVGTKEDNAFLRELMLSLINRKY